MFNKNNYLSKNNIEWILLIIGTVLLGIWAAKGTIALRNILLVIGSILSIYYFILEFCYGSLKENQRSNKILPLILLVLTFIWVLTHYFIFSVDPSEQYKELKSTWLRALLGSIIGFATGLILRNHPKRLIFIWLGILIAFIILYYQYIPRAIAKNKLLVPDYDHYIFNLKINTVLMGMILITGINGAIIDQLRLVDYSLKDLKPLSIFYWLFGTSAVLWAFVYIIDSRNGIGLSIILFSFWFICALVLFITRQLKQPNLKNFLVLFVACFGISLVLYFANLQMNINKGWDTLFADAKIAVQIEKYRNWQNISKMGYPKREDGKTVTQNTYERVAWATAGARAIISYPLGVGVLSYPFSKHQTHSQEIELNQNLPKIATHSGWVELGLAFGIPILLLIFVSIVLIFIEAICNNFPAKITILSFTIMIIFLYAVGEVAIQHGLEILYFLLFLLAALVLNNNSANSFNK